MYENTKHKKNHLLVVGDLDLIKHGSTAMVPKVTALQNGKMHDDAEKKAKEFER